MDEDDCVKCNWYVNHVCNCPYDSCCFEEYRPYSYTKEELEQLKHNIYNQTIDEYMNVLCDYCMQQNNDCCKTECPFCVSGCYIVVKAEQLKEKKECTD